MRRLIVAGAVLALGLSVNFSAVEAGNPHAQPGAWAHCVEYSSIVANNELPPQGKFDELYAGAVFKNGIEIISDAAPGDQYYNGGRWHLNVLKSSVDPAKYADACSVDDLDLNDFDSTEMYFACPLRPRRGNGPR